MDAQQATDIAMDFVRKHFLVARPRRAVRQDGQWRVEVDVGIFAEQIGWVEVDAHSGEILRYELPRP